LRQDDHDEDEQLKINSN